MAKEAERCKKAKYSLLTTDFIFAPVAVETLGTFGAESKLFIQDLSKRLIAATRDKKAGHYFRQRLGLTIQRWNAVAIMGTMVENDGPL